MENEQKEIERLRMELGRAYRAFDAALQAHAAEAAQPAAQAEPVGFILRSVDPPYDYWPESFVLGAPQDDESETEQWEPLYAHPPAQAQDSHCPHIVTSDEGTAHCRLAEQGARDAWQPIETAPRDGTEIVVWCDGVQDLPPLASLCAWHPDAGFCVDELREPKYWIAPPNARVVRREP